jgi:hypothetical protein
MSSRWTRLRDGMSGSAPKPGANTVECSRPTSRFSVITSSTLFPNNTAAATPRTISPSRVRSATCTRVRISPASIRLTGRWLLSIHPRRENWDEHFEMLGLLVAGRTPTGRATVAVFNMNDPARVAVREANYNE